MTDDEKTAVILTTMAVKLDAQSDTPAFMTPQEKAWAGGMRRLRPKRAAHELLAGGSGEELQRAHDLLDQVAGELMDDDPEFGGFTDFDLIGSPFDESRLREVIESALETLDVDRVECAFCDRPVPAATAHLHQGERVGDECCWDERLRGTE